MVISSLVMPAALAAVESAGDGGPASVRLGRMPVPPRLPLGVPLLRRDRTHLQVGLDPAVVLPDAPDVRALLDRLRDGEDARPDSPATRRRADPPGGRRAARGPRGRRRTTRAAARLHRRAGRPRGAHRRDRRGAAPRRARRAWRPGCRSRPTGAGRGHQPGTAVRAGGPRRDPGARRPRRGRPAPACRTWSSPATTPARSSGRSWCRGSRPACAAWTPTAARATRGGRCWWSRPLVRPPRRAIPCATRSRSAGPPVTCDCGPRDVRRRPGRRPSGSRTPWPSPGRAGTRHPACGCAWGGLATPAAG